MARISSYPTDDNVSGSDKVLGTDTSGATKNYLLDEVGKYFSENNKISVGGQVIYIYQSSLQDLATNHGYFTINDGAAGTGVNMSSITNIIINKSVDSQTSVETLLTKVFEDQVRIYGVTEPDQFFDFSVVRIEDHDEVSNAYKVTLMPISGSDTAIFENTNYYAITPNSGDKTYAHLQSSASATWTITHNLNKYPSVSVQDSAGNDCFGKITYNSLRQLTITFSSSFSGAAYLN